jgi:type VI secretion system protein ImpM
VITAPSIFGKLPAVGDFVRHNAPLAQVESWRSLFHNWEEAAPGKKAASSAANHPADWLYLTPPSLAGYARLRPAEPCYFILRPRGVQFPSDSPYLIGVLAASRDRVGRRYPLVAWQAVSAEWAVRLLAAPAHWLTGLAQLIHEYTCLPGRVDVASAVNDLWAVHRPGWRDRFSAPFRRRSEAGPSDLTGPAEIRNDWPPTLLRAGSHGSVWQAGTGYAMEIESAHAIRRIVAAL